MAHVPFPDFTCPCGPCLKQAQEGLHTGSPSCHRVGDEKAQEQRDKDLFLCLSLRLRGGRLRTFEVKLVASGSYQVKLP